MIIESEKLIKLISPQSQGWRDIKTEEYHADKSAVNFSSLKHMDKSPHAFAQSFWGKPKEPTKSMKFGTLAHMAILEGDKFKSRYQVMPEFVGRTLKGEITTSKNSKEVQAQIAEWTANLAPDAIIISQDERDDLFNMIESVLSNEKAVKLLSKGKPEAIGYWTDPETGINCRMMNDFLTFQADIWMDVKTTTDSRWEYFRKSVENLQYYLQTAMYLEGIKNITGKEVESAAWLAIESSAPYEVRIHEVSPIYREIGLMEFRRYMRELKICIDSKKFSQRGNIIEIGEPSGYFKQKYEFNEEMI